MATISCSRLLELPPELRNCIYELAFTQPWDTPHDIEVLQIKQYAPSPALAQTSQQIRAESLPLFQQACHEFSDSHIFYVCIDHEFNDPLARAGLSAEAKAQKIMQTNIRPRSIEFRVRGAVRYGRVFDFTFTFMVDMTNGVPSQSWRTSFVKRPRALCPFDISLREWIASTWQTEFEDLTDMSSSSVRGPPDGVSGRPVKEAPEI